MTTPDSQKETVNLDFNRALLVRHAWERFQQKVVAVHTLDDALALLTETTPVGSPSYPFYANLAEFLRTLRRPTGSGPEEWSLYAALVERLVASGSIQQADGAESLAALACPTSCG